MSDIESLSLSSSQRQRTLKTSQFMTLSRSLVEIMMMILTMMRTSQHEHLRLLNPMTARLVVPALLHQFV